MYNHWCNPILTNCIFAGNSANNMGGAIYITRTSNVTLTNCTFVANSATNGNAVACYFQHPEHPPSNLEVANCILWDGGNEIWKNNGSIITITYSNVQDGWTGEGNIDADPLFADAQDGDYHLKSQAGRWDPNGERWVPDDVTSPCIDAGNPGCPLGDEPNDVNNIRINMGAYGGTAEASKTPANWRNIADLTNDWTVDFNDLKVFVDYWLDTGECIPSDLNRSQSADFIDFAIFAENWLW
jgi:hypothetical protein